MSTLADNAPRMAGAGDWIDAALAPRSVAIVGASDNPEKIGGRPIKYMLQHGYQGRILPINPGRDRVQGIAAWHSLDAVDVPIDMLLVCVAGEAAVQAVRDGARLGVRVCVVISSGFAETGEPGRQAQEHMKAAAAAAGMRLLGPNTQGLANFSNGALATFATLLGEVAPADGPVAVISQSGAMSMVPYAHLRAEGIGVRYSVATGNECDLNVADFTEAVLRDPEVRLILLYMESLPAPATLARAAALARSRQVPVLALKAGVSPQGLQAAQSHTGAIATEDKALDAWFRQHGILRVPDARSLVMGAQLLLRCGHLPGNRLAILSNSGAACVTGADAAERHGLQVPPLPAETRARIDAVLPGFASSLNPIDLTAALLSNNHLFGQVLPILASARACDALFITLPMSGKGYDTDQFARDAAAFTAETGLPVVVSCPLAASRRIFAQAGLATFEHDEDALAALGQLARLSGLRETALRLARPAPHAPAAPVPRTAGLLSEADSLEQIEAIGIRTAPWRLCLDADSMGSALGSLPGPWAVKACSAQIPHKSEYGLVHLGIADEQRARALFPVLRQEVLGMGKSFDGVIVASMVKPRREFMIGARWDSQFGCIVIVGDGGKYVEAMPDVATLVYPFDQAHAEECLRKLRVAALFDGVRGENPLPVQELAHAATRLGAWLHAQQGAVASVDINPLIAGPDGRLYAADALVEI
ncbi:acetate--CoA ligase family protein [Bordetella bronchiseptica]|uniref:acetate--CoA ligase family protein n=1 Tax=Bordetella bronchiseptica TaxID=518 RepID=UPI00143EE85F|nr:acetate--CoA ligase family protein [Bordetella bronchiseptica]QIY02432.1 acetate--CoA ligase family protein [Bordetella bronchiseptica]